MFVMPFGRHAFDQIFHECRLVADMRERLR
jgi:hypothetical protein